MPETFNVPDNFSEILHTKYEAALATKNIIFADSTSEIKTIDDTDYCITLVKSLMKRPENGTRKKNPFEKCEPDLTILESYGDAYKVIYNKFPITSEHFMMITKEFVSQNTPLSPTDLSGIFKLLNATDKQTGKRHFAFYNCGPDSGASQPHKHIQFLKFPDSYTPYPDYLCHGVKPFVPSTRVPPLQNKNLPFAHFVLPLPRDDKDIDQDTLGLYFISLLQRVLSIMRETDRSVPSYNFILTRKWMMLVPRSSGIYKEQIGINSTGFIGLILVKNEQLRELILNDGPENVLEAIGFPNTAESGPEDFY